MSADNSSDNVYFLSFSPGNISNSNVTIKLAQLHYFLSQNIGGTKDNMSPSVQKLGDTPPPLPSLNSVPGVWFWLTRALLLRLEIAQSCLYMIKMKRTNGKTCLQLTVHIKERQTQDVQFKETIKTEPCCLDSRKDNRRI